MWTIVIFIVVAFAALKLIGFTGSAPVRPSVLSELPACPSSPNCVCSQDPRESHSVTPLRISENTGADWKRLVEVVQRMGGRIVEEREFDYARFEFRSRIMRYVDDVEILMNEKERRIEIRSASRSGYSDFGVNRRRVERIRDGFEGIRTD